MSKIINSDSLLLHVHEKAKFKITKANDIDKTYYTERSLKEYIQIILMMYQLMNLFLK